MAEEILGLADSWRRRHLLCLPAADLRNKCGHCTILMLRARASSPCKKEISFVLSRRLTKAGGRASWLTRMACDIQECSPPITARKYSAIQGRPIDRDPSTRIRLTQAVTWMKMRLRIMSGNLNRQCTTTSQSKKKLFMLQLRGEHPRLQHGRLRLFLQ